MIMTPLAMACQGAILPQPCSLLWLQPSTATFTAAAVNSYAYTIALRRDMITYTERSCTLPFRDMLLLPGGERARS